MDANGELVNWAKGRGWEKERTAKGHLKFVHPKIPKSAVYGAGTPSDYRSTANIRSKMKSLERQHGLLNDGRDRKRKTTEPFEASEKRTLDGAAVVAILHSIKCSAANCGAEDQQQQALTSKAPTASNIASLFRRRGWYAKRERRFDLCPACCHKLGKQVSARAKDVADFSQALSLQKPVWTLRRRIMREINRMYVDPDIGYMAGESDAAIALRLSVDEGTVAHIRGELFGPVPKGTEIVHLTREIARLERELKAFTEATLSGSAKLETTIASVRVQLTALRKHEVMEEDARPLPTGNGSTATQ